MSAVRVCWTASTRRGPDGETLGYHGICCTRPHLLGTVCPVDEGCTDERCEVHTQRPPQNWETKWYCTCDEEFVTKMELRAHLKSATEDI